MSASPDISRIILIFEKIHLAAREGSNGNYLMLTWLISLTTSSFAKNSPRWLFQNISNKKQDSLMKHS